MTEESKFDAKIRENGNSMIITIPSKTIEKLKLKKKEIIEVSIKKSS